MKLFFSSILLLLLVAELASVNINSCQNLNSASTTYDLTASISPITGEANSSCLNITAANVILDGHNFFVVGLNNSRSVGVNISNSGVIVKNIQIQDFEKDIQLNDSAGAHANSVTIQNASLNVTRNSGTGVNIVIANFTTINASTIIVSPNSNNGVGLNVTTHSHNGTIANSSWVIQSAGTRCVAISPSAVNAQNWTIFNNTFNQSNSSAGSTADIFSMTATQINISNNTFNQTAGFSTMGTSNLTFFGNTFINTGTSRALLLGAAANSTISNNIFNSSGTAANAIEGNTGAVHNITIQYNIFNFSASGNAIAPSSNANIWTIINNTIVVTSGAGISSIGTKGWVVINNTYNSTTGLFWSSASSPDNNSIVEFNIINATGPSGAGNGEINYQSGSNFYDNNTIANNTFLISGTMAGFNIGRSENSTYSNNSILCTGVSSQCDGILMNSPSRLNVLNTISFNTINITGGGQGIQIDSASNITVINNSIFISTTANGYGIYFSVASPQNNTVANNTINSSCSGCNGIYSIAASSYNNTLTNNTINVTSTGVGIYFNPMTNSTISQNTISTTGSSAFGIRLSGLSQNNTIFNNTINTSGSSGHGIYMTVSNVNFSNISFNIVNVTGSSANGLNITGAYNNSFWNNTFSSESAIDADIDGTSGNNTFTNNSFTKGSKYMRDKSVSTYLNTTDSQGNATGNYWGDILLLSIYDTDGNGYGDRGSKYPYNATNSANYSTGNATDNGPITTRRTAYVSALSATPTSGLDCSQNISLNLTVITNILNANAGNPTINISCIKNGNLYTGCGYNGSISNGSWWQYNFTLTSGVSTTGDNWSFNASANDTISSSGPNSTNNVTVATCSGAASVFAGWVFPNPNPVSASWKNYTAGDLTWKGGPNNKSTRLGPFTLGEGILVMNGTNQYSRIIWIPE